MRPTPGRLVFSEVARRIACLSFSPDVTMGEVRIPHGRPAGGRERRQGFGGVIFSSVVTWKRRNLAISEPFDTYVNWTNIACCREPGNTLLLLGTGVAGLCVRRLRMRGGTSGARRNYGAERATRDA
jgi:hypothetical protein